MRNKLIIAIIVALFTTVQAYSQTTPLKVGYTDVDYILSQLPEAKQIEADLTAYQKQLSNQLESKNKELETKYKAYQEGAAAMADPIRADKEEELRSLQNSIQKFSKEADESLQKRQATALKPIYDKIQKAIDDVAKENGYTFILSSYVGGVPVLLYATEQDNVSNLIFKKLGVNPDTVTEKPAETTTAPANKPAETTPAQKKPAPKK